MVFGFFTPYNEGPPNPLLNLAPDASGSDTTAIDHMRQGVEITTNVHRYAGTLPKFETDDDQHQLDVIVFGQSSEFFPNTYFEEIVTFDPVAFLESNEQLIFPVVLENRSMEDPEKLGGFIQPLAIPSRDLLVASAEFEPHDIRAHLMDGNESVFRNTNQIVELIDLLEPQQVDDLYIDASENIGFASGSIILQGLFPENERIRRPFDESMYLSKSFRSGSITGSVSYDIVAVLVSNSLDDHDTRVPYGYRAACAGFSYDNTPLGTDSLAFGGLKR